MILSFMPFDHGKYAGPYVTDIVSLEDNSSILMLKNSPPLFTQNPIKGIPTSTIQVSLIAIIIVSTCL